MDRDRVLRSRLRNYTHRITLTQDRTLKSLNQAKSGYSVREVCKEELNSVFKLDRFKPDTIKS